MKKGDVWLAATLSDTVIITLLNEGIDVYNPRDYKALGKRLNDPDMRKWRVWQGKI